MATFLQRALHHNLGLKIISLGLAVALWVAVKRDPVDEMGVNVPIEFHNLTENLEIATENIPQAQILVRGPEREVHRLEPSDVHVEVDLSGVKPGERTFELSAHEVRLPHDLEVVQVIPAQLHLSFDTRMSRQVELKPRVTGTFAGQRIASISVDPKIITISGPAARVKAVENAITDPVDATGTIDRGTFVTHAYVADPLVQVTRPVPVRVTVVLEKISPN